ncbi:UNVERIFIED_CONTAM: hypothetical protein GTU68_034531 [Idotea baltica]|nr:hypothetical protein [Idotea baltica]
MLRAGLIRQLMAGAYTYLPLGYRCVRKVEAIVREEMDAAGGAEIFMPALQPIDLFERTGRKDAFGDVLINFNIKRGDRQLHMALGPTHEEVVTDLMSKHLNSYKQLPLTVYQIQTKFRNEERPRFGVLRTSEFLMKDAYSFGSSLEQLNEAYDAMFKAYCRIFARCGLEYIPVEAESGAIGGDASHEFMVPAEHGEDQVVRCKSSGYAANLERAETGRKGRDYQLQTTYDLRDATEGDPCPKSGEPMEMVHGIEVGHVFKLGTKYSESMNAMFLDEKEVKHPLIMGCYGIGVTRLVAALAETNHDDNGLVWPLATAPYSVLIIPLNDKDEEVKRVSEQAYAELNAAGIDVLFDDRKARPGFKFKDADLIGIPLRMVIGGKGLKEGQVEIKWRTDDGPTKVPVESGVATVLKMLAERRAEELLNVPK